MATTLTWLGHGCFQLEVADQTILIDPFLTGNPAAAASPGELQPDFIVLTHGHSDHVGDTVSIAQRTHALVIANFEITEWLKRQKVDNVHPLNTGGGHQFAFGRLKFTIAHHTSMLPDGSNGGNPCGLLFTFPDGKKFYHAGDTGLFYDMHLIGEEGIDLATLPLGDNFTMGPDDALRAVKLINPAHVIPEHYNTWELIAQDAQQWAERVQAETSARPTILQPGESFTLSP
jgi:L-ascorbate metabolism protein UlaG (beta-lactamase superfamily)